MGGGDSDGGGDGGGKASQVSTALPWLSSLQISPF